jgi:hypothetical protein
MSRVVFVCGWVLAALLLAGCETPTARKDQGSPYYAVPVGATLELHQALEIRPGATRAWIQGGEVVAGINSYVPNCNIEVGRRDDSQPQLVQPDRFRVRRTQSFFEWVVEAAPAPRYADAVDDGGASMVYEGYHLWLESAAQPDVRRLSCRGVYAMPSDARPPSIVEIRAALGDVATLRLP